MSQMADTLRGILKIEEGRVTVLAPLKLSGLLMERLIQTAHFHGRSEMRAMARWIVKRVAPQCGEVSPEMTANPLPSLREEMVFAAEEIIVVPEPNTGVQPAGHG